jgi:hypothetical protein
MQIGGAMRIIPSGHFLVVNEFESKQSEESLIVIPTDTKEEPFLPWEVVSIGNKVDGELYAPGDIVLAKRSDINIMRIPSKQMTCYYVDADMTAKVEDY